MNVLRKNFLSSIQYLVMAMLMTGTGMYLITPHGVVEAKAEVKAQTSIQHGQGKHHKTVTKNKQGQQKRSTHIVHKTKQVTAKRVHKTKHVTVQRVHKSKQVTAKRVHKTQHVIVQKVSIRHQEVAQKEPVKKKSKYPLVKGESVEALSMLSQYPKLNVMATGYSPGPESTGKNRSHPAFGITYSGVKARRDTFSTIAADIRVFPLGSVLYIPGYGYGIVTDTGSAIKGNKIDLYFDTKEDVYKEWGKKKIDVYLIEKGNGKVDEQMMRELNNLRGSVAKK